MIWNPLSLILWTFVIALYFYSAIRYLIIGMVHEISDEKLISFGISVLFFGSGISTILFISSELNVPGTFINHIFIGNYENTNIIYEILFRYKNIVFYSCGVVTVYIFDRIFKRTKFLLTILNIFAIFLLVVLPFDIMNIFNQIYFIVFGITFLIVPLVYTKWSRVQFKVIPLFFLFGIIFMGAGILLSDPSTKEFNIVPLEISPILTVLGPLICLIPTLFSPERVSKILKNWKIVGALNLGLLCAVWFYYIMMGLSPLIHLGVPLELIIIIYSLVIIQKSVKSESLPGSKIELIDVSKAFIKPSKVTEEEVSISKEKKICLVCKGKLSRKLYMCPKCNTLYCQNCSNSLADLENTCWVCDEPIDPSKPIKLAKEDEEIITENFKKD